jgi:hypothetical protein
VEAIIEGTRGPVVDGRAYADPAFRQMLENYHTAVVRAQKEHGRVAAPIPVPIPTPPAELEAEPVPGTIAAHTPATRATTPRIGGPPPRPDGS